MTTPAFKIGDRVVYFDPKSSSTFGSGTVTSVAPTMSQVSYDKNPKTPLWTNNAYLISETPAFQVGDVVRRNTWKETTTATIIWIADDGTHFKVKFDANGANSNYTYDTSEFVLVSRHGQPQPKFKKNDRVVAPKFYDGQGTVLEDSNDWGTKVLWDNGQESHTRNEYVSPAQPQFKPGDRVWHALREELGTICQAQPTSKDNRNLWVAWDQTGVSNYTPNDLLRPAPPQVPDVSDQALTNPKLFLDEFATTLEDLTGLPTFKDTTTMRPIKITNATYVNGTDVAKLEDETIVALIKESEDQVKTLSELQHKPKRIEKLIADLNDGIAQLVAVLDQRDETKH